MSYGALVCDLDRRRIVDLLPNRGPATVAAWLASHPGLEIVARDRGGSYARAAAQGASQAQQVADRWHLMENASAAFLSAVRRSMTTISKVVDATIVDVALLTSAERLQCDGYCRRREAAEVIRTLALAGTAIKEIARRTDRSRNHVRDVLRGGGRDVFRSRATILAPYLDALDAEWEAGCRRGAELWRRLRRLGFSGSVRIVTEWATRRRRAEAVGGVGLGRVPSARRLARLLTIDRDSLSKADAMIVASIEKDVPVLAIAYAERSAMDWRAMDQAPVAWVAGGRIKGAFFEPLIDQWRIQPELRLGSVAKAVPRFHPHAFRGGGINILARKAFAFIRHSEIGVERRVIFGVHLGHRYDAHQSRRAHPWRTVRAGGTRGAQGWLLLAILWVKLCQGPHADELGHQEASQNKAVCAIARDGEL